MEVAEDQQHLEAATHEVPGQLLDQRPAHPEVDDERREDDKMTAQSHAVRVQET